MAGAAPLATVTVRAADVVALPAASRACAASVCPPLDAVVVFHAVVYGAAVSGAPSGPPSRRNCTLVTPMSSEAVAETVTELPATVAPLAGAVIDTAGAVVSALLTVTVTGVAG